MLVAEPVAASFHTPKVLINLLFGSCLLLAVLPSATKRTRIFLIAAMLLLIAVRIVSERDDVPIDFGPVLALYGLTGLLAAAGSLRFAGTSPKIDSETVHAALAPICLQACASVFSIPPSNSAGQAALPGQAVYRVCATYYSFVTWRRSATADFCLVRNWREASQRSRLFGGQLYLAVMVARLIGAFDIIKKS